MTSACVDRDAEAAGDGEHRDGGGEVDVELGTAVVDEVVDEQVDRLLDPVVDPPLRLGGHERRLHERPVAPVLRAAHRQHAAHERDAVAAGTGGVGRRGEHLVVAEGGVARLEAERREVRSVRERQPLEHRVAREAR